jgi:hypothetical protein
MVPSLHILIELPVSRSDFGGYKDEDESKEAGAMSKKKLANEPKVCCPILGCTLMLC